MKVWTTDVSALYVGATSASKAYLGSIEVFSATPPTPPYPTAWLIGEWLLDGNTLDTSGFWNDGTPQGITYIAWHGWVQSAVFSGSQYITLPSTSINNLTAGTISIWAKRWASWSQYAFVDKLTSGVSNRIQFMLDDLNNVFRFRINDQTLAPYPVDTSTDWIHWVGTFEQWVGMKMYKNGNLDSQNSTSTYLPSSSDTIYIWCVWGFTAFMVWQLQGLRVYNRALDLTEIGQLYSYGK